MVAIRIQIRDSAAHGTSVLADRMTASSQGALMKAMDAIEGALAPKVDRADAINCGEYENWDRTRQQHIGVGSY